MSQFSVYLDPEGNLTMTEGGIHCLHGTTTYFPVGGGESGLLPRGVMDPTVQRDTTRGDSFHGGSGRNLIVKNGPADPAFPAGYFGPTVPDEWNGPKAAQILRDAMTGVLSLHDGTDVVAATAGAVSDLSGTPSAGSFPFTDWGVNGIYPGLGVYYQAVGAPWWVAFHDTNTGDVTVTAFGVVNLTRTGGSTTDPGGVWVANSAAQTEYNSGNPWNYVVTSGGLTSTASSTSYGEATYNGGIPFTFDIEAESGMPPWPNAPVDIAPYAGTAQAGLYDPTGWQSWQSRDDPGWTVTIDGTGAGVQSDGIDIVATRAADLDRLYDPGGGVWVATPYGEATYNAGDPWAGKATRTLATPMEGKLYIEITVDGSNEVTAVDGPFFAASLLANSSTLKVFLIAESDGAGGIRQIWEGPIQWHP
jgi:hypothetical protein